jgi:hypothetical protein
VASQEGLNCMDLMLQLIFLRFTCGVERVCFNRKMLLGFKETK